MSTDKNSLDRLQEVELNEQRTHLQNEIKELNQEVQHIRSLTNSSDNQQRINETIIRLNDRQSTYSYVINKLSTLKNANTNTNDLPNFLILMLADLVGIELYIQFLQASSDSTSLLNTLRELTPSDTAKIELIDLIGKNMETFMIDLIKASQFIKAMNPDEISAGLTPLLNNLSRAEEDAPNESLNTLAQKILLSNGCNNLLDLCSGQGCFLESAYQKNNKVLFLGQEINPFNYMISKYKFYKSGSTRYEIKLGDVLEAPKFVENNQLKTFDRVFSNFPFLQKVDFEKIYKSIKLWQTYPISFSYRNTADWLFAGLVLNHLKHDGKAVVIMSCGPLSKAMDREIRQQLVEDGRIETIIRLPDNMFSFARISSAMLVLGRGNKSIQMIDASALATQGRRFKEFSDDQVEQIYNLIQTKEVTDISHNIAFEEIMRNDFNLDPYPYFVTNQINIPNPVKLASVTKDIFRGVQISADELDQMIIPHRITTDPYKIVSAGDLENGMISSNLPLAYVESNKRLNRYCLEDGDIVITAKGSKNKLAVARVNLDEKIIATGNLVVIRPDHEQVNSYYLKAFFDSETGQKLIQSIQTGSITTTITPGQLETMDVALLNRPTQEKIANQYKVKLEIIQLTRKKLKTLEMELDNLFDSITRGE